MKRKRDRRNDLLMLIPEGVRTVLDVGCSDGKVSEPLKERGVRITGIERNEEKAKVAQTILDSVIVGDIEQLSLRFTDHSFDCLLFADVLEHLCDPLRLLKRYRPLLKKGGCVIASIPNIRYYKVLKNLFFKGTWDYVASGILDRTHLRFFTYITIREMFYEAGYDIVEIKRNIYAERLPRILNILCGNLLKEFVTYQYYIKAVPDENTQRKTTKRKIDIF